MTLIDVMRQIETETMDAIILTRRFGEVVDFYDFIEHSPLKVQVQGAELNDKLLSIRVKTPKVDEFVKHINTEYTVSKDIVTLIFRERS